MYPHQRMAKLIAEVSEWSHRNFGAQESKWFTEAIRCDQHLSAIATPRLPMVLGLNAPLLGMIEEIGELCEAIDDKTSLRPGLIADSMGDIFIYLADYIHRLGSDCPDPLISPENWEWIDSRLHIECPLSSPDRTVFGMMRRLGKFIHINLKRHQGIRGWGDPLKFYPEMQAILPDLIVFWGRLLYCSAPGRSNPVTVAELLSLAEMVWSSVKLRNWKTQPQTGGEHTHELDEEVSL